MWCRDWLAARSALVQLRFPCCRSPMAREHFGRLPLVDELVVIDEHGRWWAGPSPFAMCLWALEGLRTLAWWVSSDALWWLSREVFETNRAALEAAVAAWRYEAGPTPEQLALTEAKHRRRLPVATAVVGPPPHVEWLGMMDPF